jgi:GGDEF domain-containing protein
MEHLNLAEAIRATLSYPIALSAGQVKVDVSIGIARFNSELTASELLHQADQMMRRSQNEVRLA